MKLKLTSGLFFIFFSLALSMGQVFADTKWKDCSADRFSTYAGEGEIYVRCSLETYVNDTTVEKIAEKVCGGKTDPSYSGGVKQGSIKYSGGKYSWSCGPEYGSDTETHAVSLYCGKQGLAGGNAKWVRSDDKKNWGANTRLCTCHESESESGEC